MVAAASAAAAACAVKHTCATLESRTMGSRVDMHRRKAGGDLLQPWRRLGHIDRRVQDVHVAVLLARDDERMVGGDCDPVALALGDGLARDDDDA